MSAPSATAVVPEGAARRRVAWRHLLPILLALSTALAAAAPVLRLDRADVLETAAGAAKAASAVPTALPDDWSRTRPLHDGDLWYRVRFDHPPGEPDRLYALYLERACRAIELLLNGKRVHEQRPDRQLLAAGCREPQLLTLPPALLQAQDNVLELRIRGRSLQHVASREFGGGLSALQVGPRDTLAAEHARRLFWHETWPQLGAVVLIALGSLMLLLVWHNRHEVYFGYFGALCIGWALLSVRFWIGEPAWPPVVTEQMFCLGIATLVVLAVQFLLSYAGLRSRAIESALLIQWLLMPISLIIAGESRLFAVASAWYALYAVELMLISGLFLGVAWRDRRHDFWPMALVLGIFLGLLLLEFGWQQGLYDAPASLPEWPLLPLVMPVLFVVVGARLFAMFARALRTAEAGRTALARRVRELTTEFEGNFSQLAELRVEQVTEKERKRIAADLHDDLGAKLLTIVHTSDNERITALAREALEDMRLSVKGLIGKPLRLADALADWRAETVARLGQAKINVDWQNAIEETDHLLPSRGFVQTTRILREAVSNIVKHSQATNCSVRCRIADGQFAMTIRDDGRGIPLELDGNLDRGLGMSSMKRRAKQMHGQCLVQSGPGYGTVIALTVPL